MTYLPWTAGTDITADDLNAMVGTWQSYTPSWMSTGTAVSLGNGSIWGRYVIMGNTCVVNIQMVCGTTTTFGSGTYYWTMPFTSANPIDGTSNWGAGMGSARAHNAAAWWTGVTHVPKNSNQMRIYTNDTPAEWGPTQPFTWSALSSNYFTSAITYELA